MGYCDERHEGSRTVTGATDNGVAFPAVRWPRPVYLQVRQSGFGSSFRGGPRGRGLSAHPLPLQQVNELLDRFEPLEFLVGDLERPVSHAEFTHISRALANAASTESKLSSDGEGGGCPAGDSFTVKNPSLAL